MDSTYMWILCVCVYVYAYMYVYIYIYIDNICIYTRAHTLRKRRRKTVAREAAVDHAQMTLVVEMGTSTSIISVWTRHDLLRRVHIP